MGTYLWACPLTPIPQPHLPSPCFCEIKMRGSKKMAWIDAVRTTRYPLISMLFCDVFMCLVKQGVPSDDDLEWLYPSFLLYEKEFLELLARLQTRDINGLSPNPFTWRWQFFLLVEKKSRRYLLSAYVGMDFSCKNSDEDLESIYPSCSLYEKEFFRVFRSIANQRYKWYVTKSVYVAMTVFLTG